MIDLNLNNSTTDFFSDEKALLVESDSLLMGDPLMILIHDEEEHIEDTEAYAIASEFITFYEDYAQSK